MAPLTLAVLQDDGSYKNETVPSGFRDLHCFVCRPCNGTGGGTTGTCNTCQGAGFYYQLADGRTAIDPEGE